MTLIDTSAWVEYLRATGSEAHLGVRQVLHADAEVHTTDVVVMELVAGARDDDHLAQLRRLIGRCRYVPVEGLGDYETAAALYLQCRRAGSTVRALTDCLIATVALRAELAVLHSDRDFDVLARHTGLKTYREDAGRR